MYWQIFIKSGTSDLFGKEERAVLGRRMDGGIPPKTEHRYASLSARGGERMYRGGTAPRTKRLHNYPALEAPDTEHLLR